MEKEYQPTGKTYNIKTVKQLFDIVNEDNIDLIMVDLYRCCEVMIAMDGLNKATCKEHKTKYKKFTLSNFQWIDDGKHNPPKVTLGSNDNILDINEMVSKLPDNL